MTIHGYARAAAGRGDRPRAGSPAGFRRAPDRRPITGLGGAAAAVLVAAFPAVLHAQGAPAALEGTLVSDPAGDPVEGVSLVLRHRASATRTDGSGGFLFENLRPGLDTLEIRHPGFRREVWIVQLVAGRTVHMHLELETVPDPDEVIALDPLSVVAEAYRPPTLRGFDERRVKAAGAFITRSEIEERRPHQPSDLLRHLAGIQVETDRVGDTRILMGRGNVVCTPTLYVDGMPLRPVFLDDYRPEHIEAIEVYTRAARAPAPYRSGQCGVILVWSRETYD